jgi:c-di-GMP-binding flagellar brake protein YcgR
MTPEESSDSIGRVNQRDLGVDWGMRLMIRFRGFSESYKGTLVGIDRGSYLICSVPQLKGIWVRVNQEKPVEVRYLHRGVVYGFKCTLLSLVEEPVNLILLSYPEAIESVTLRKHERIPCLILATVQADGRSWKGRGSRLEPGWVQFCIPSFTGG